MSKGKAGISAPWLEDERVQDIFGFFEKGGFGAYFVGGSVRNALMGRDADDIDIATDARPNEVLEIARRSGMKAIPTGIAHGTVTLVSGGEKFEVTSFRRDVETDGRRAVVAFTRNIEEDAMRRDFTMNALYADRNGHVMDPLGSGVEDARNRRVRFVGSAEERIREDALRMMRFFRFAATCGRDDGGMDAEGITAISEHRDLARNLSRERVTSETIKILGADNPVQAVEAMRKTGLLHVVLPEVQTRGLRDLVRLEGEKGVRPGWHRRASLMRITDGKLQDLRLSKADARRLSDTRAAGLMRGTPAQKSYRFGREAAVDGCLISLACRRDKLKKDWKKEIDRGSSVKMPVRAADLPALSGPAVGAELKRIESVFLSFDLNLSREELLRRSGGNRAQQTAIRQGDPERD